MSADRRLINDLVRAGFLERLPNGNIRSTEAGVCFFLMLICGRVS